MITREQQVSSRTQLVVTAVVCDRCGEDARQVQGIGVPSDYSFDGAAINGRIYPRSGNAAEILHVEIELCGSCLQELAGWVGKGAHVGVKGRDLIDNIPQPL